MKNSFCLVFFLASCAGYTAVPRRAYCLAGVAACLSRPTPAVADEDYKLLNREAVVLTEEEMASRVARKQELLRAKGAAPQGSATDVRSDVNPEAGITLRSRSIEDNLKASLAKQDELKKRDKKQKRDDMCEMLGRGC